MRNRILSDWNFRGEKGGWLSPTGDPDQHRATRSGMICSAAKGEKITVAGPGVHTRNNDSIELSFSPQRRGEGVLTFGFMSFSEYVRVQLDLKRRVASLSSSDCTRPQRLARTTFSLPRQSSHCLVIEKREGPGDLVKNADIRVILNGKTLLCAKDVNVAPELGVMIEIGLGSILLQRFRHRGVPTGIPEYLHVAALQVANSPSMEKNVKSILRGLQLAADRGVQLLVTPETSITGLFPFHPVSNNPGPIADAERKIRRFMKQLKNAPFLVAGLPVWMAVEGHRNKTTRYNASRLYDHEGQIVTTCPKIHSCEDSFWHGYRLHEFDIYGVPTCLHICHDGRYPEVWTLPVMFGSRLVLHPCNGETITGSIEAAERSLEIATHTSHAFYICANGGGDSGIAGPQKGGNIIAISDECRRDAPSFPTVGEPQECLVAGRIRVHDAFGYWPVRSFRASEQVAQAYVQLYGAYGGAR